MNLVHKLKRAVAVIATFSLLASNASVAIAQTFNDVPTDHWAFDYIEQLVDEGVFDVADNFNPNDPLNRAMLVKIVITAIDGLAGYEAPATPTFDDVAADAWFYDYVEAAVQLGIVAGYTDAAGNLTGMFGPGDTVNRAQATKVLVNAFNVPTTLTPAGSFPDVMESAWFYPYVTTAYNQSILDGYANGNFGPADPVTRAQVAKLTVNAQNPVVRAAVEEEEEAPAEEEEEEVPAVSEGDLEVSLNDSTPRASTVPLGASSVGLATFDFTAADDDVRISNIAVTRGGVGTAGDWAELFLYDGVKRLTTGRTISSDTNLVTFPVSFTVEAGTTLTVRLVGRAETAAGGAVANDQHYFYLASASDVTSNAQSVAGDFPVAGNTFTIGGQEVNDLTVTEGTAIAQPLIGATNAEVSTFRTVAGADNDIAVHNITLTQNGTLDSSKLQNCKLLRGTDVVASTDVFDDRERITFVLDTPFVIPEGQTKTWYVRCDIDGGKATDSLQLYMDETSDIVAIDQQYGYGAAITNGFTTDDVVAVTLKGGKVTISDNGPAARQVAQNITNIELLNYSITTDRNLTVRDAVVMVSLSNDGTAAGRPDVDAAFAAAEGIDAVEANTATNSYDVSTETVGGEDTLEVGDMVLMTDGVNTFYGRMLANDGDSDGALDGDPLAQSSLTVSSTSDLTTLALATATVVEVNAYAYLKNLRVIDADTGATLQGPLTLVSQGTKGDAAAVDATTNTVYRRQFTEDYELEAGETRHLSIQVDTDQFMAAGYQATASISYSNATDGTDVAESGYIKDFAANENVEEADIVGDDLLGKPMTVASNTLAVALAASPNPTNTQFIKGQTGVQAVGFNVTAGDAGDITIKKFKVRAVADDDGDFDEAAAGVLGDIEAKRLISSISLYDSNTLVGEAKGPTISGGGAYVAETDFDEVEFDNLNIVIPAGTTKTLVAQINLQSTLTDANADFVAIYLAAADITAEDKDANAITASGGTVNDQNAADSYPRLVTIQAQGTLTVQQKSSPQASLKVAGTNKQLVAQYEFAASREAWNVNELTVINDTTGAFGTELDTSAVKKVWIEYPDVNGVMQTIGTTLSAGAANFSLSVPTPSLYVAKDGVALVKIYVDVATTADGESLSGQNFRLGLQDDNADSADGTFRAVGAASGESEYNPTVTGFASVYNHFVRFSVPTVAKDGGNEGLSGAEILYSAKVTADAAGPRGIDLKRIVYRLSAVFGDATDELHSFRVRRGASGSDKLNTEVSITGKSTAGLNAADIYACAAAPCWDAIDGDDDGDADGYVVVDFVDPEGITAGASAVFQLRATIVGASAQGDQVSTYIPDDTVYVGTSGAGTVAKAPGCYYLIDPAAGVIDDAYVLVDLDCDGVADNTLAPWVAATSEPRLNVLGIGNGAQGFVAELAGYAAQVGQTSGTLVRGQLAVMDPDITVANNHFFWFDEDADGVLDATEIVLDATNVNILAVDAPGAPGFQARVEGAVAGTNDYAYVTMASPFLFFDTAAGAGLAVAGLQGDTGDGAFTVATDIGIDLLGETDDLTATDDVFVGGGTQTNFVWSDNSVTSVQHTENTTDWTNGYLVDTLSTTAKTMAY